MILHAVIWTVIGASVEARAFQSVLELLGYETRVARRVGPGLLVIPSGAVLSPKESAKVRAFIENGGDAVIPASLFWGTPSDTPIIVKDVTELAHPERYLRWNPTATIGRFTLPPGAQVLMQDQPTHQPLAFFGTLGKGRYLALAAEFDTTSDLGTSRYPYFAEYLKRAVGYRSNATRQHIEAYFDPGFRPNTDFDALTQQWHEEGISAIYAAAWYDLDYARLIERCHARNIAVYAWLGLPMVTRAFWDEQPEWRAKKTSWRYPLNFEISQARRAAFDWTRRLLDQYHWDGVNIAEMNYEGSGGSAENVTAWHRELLETLRHGNIEIIITTFDSIATPALRTTHGVDTPAIAALAKHFPFTLQLEDSYELWPTRPDRYRRFAANYRRSFMFDLNVVADRDVENTNLPSALATGTEFLQLLRHAAVNGRVAVYSESTVAPYDWEFAAAAVAAGTRQHHHLITSPR